MNLNAAMNSMTKNYFLLALFVIHSATSDKSQISKNFNKNLTEKNDTENENNHRYKNETLFQMNELMELNEREKIQFRTLDFVKRVLGHRKQILGSRENTLIQTAKMMYDIDNLNYLMKKSLKEAKNPEALEDSLRHASWNEKLRNEQVKSMSKLRKLKLKVLGWQSKINFPTDNNQNHVSDVLRNILDLTENSTEQPLKMSWNNSNDEELLILKFHIDLECDELEKLQRFSLIIQDELNEMPKPRHEIPEDYEKSQSTRKPQDALPKVADLPLWLLNEKDI
ncbi:uncharacterized protein LOC135835209 isoform X2 [Planococcus citri]|uniref:uncharacterized protein LOC135835209 isoform X2 n=1 Tax=Planococcus citri TaxID=170843 RepID=UPI0031F7B011